MAGCDRDGTGKVMDYLECKRVRDTDRRECGIFTWVLCVDVCAWCGRADGDENENDEERSGVRAQTWAREGI